MKSPRFPAPAGAVTFLRHMRIDDLKQEGSLVRGWSERGAVEISSPLEAVLRIRHAPRSLDTNALQSRWGYESEAELRATVAGYRSRDLPLDCIYLDRRATETRASPSSRALSIAPPSR